MENKKKEKKKIVSEFAQVRKSRPLYCEYIHVKLHVSYVTSGKTLSFW